MAAPFRKRRLSGEARRALELLVDQRGTTEALMHAHGVTERMLGRLVRAGLITIRHEMIKAGVKPIEVGKVRMARSLTEHAFNPRSVTSTAVYTGPGVNRFRDFWRH